MVLVCSCRNCRRFLKHLTPPHWFPCNSESGSLSLNLGNRKTIASTDAWNLKKLSETAESCMAWSIRAVVGCCPEPKGPKFTSLAAENAVKYPPTNRDDWKYTPKKRIRIFVGTHILYWLLRCSFFLGDAQWFEPHLERYRCFFALGNSKQRGVLGGRARDLPLVFPSDIWDQTHFDNLYRNMSR